MSGNLYPKPTCEKGYETIHPKKHAFHIKWFGFKFVFEKCGEWPCQGSYHPSTCSLAGSLPRKNSCGCDNVLDCGHWMIPILELSWLISNTEPTDVIPDCSIWFGFYPPKQLAMNNRTTGKVNHHTTTALAPIKLHESSSFFTNSCPWFGDPANICLLSQHLLTQPASLIQAVACSSGQYPPEMRISDAVRSRRKHGQAKFPSLVFVMFCETTRGLWKAWGMQWNDSFGITMCYIVWYVWPMQTRGTWWTFKCKLTIAPGSIHFEKRASHMSSEVKAKKNVTWSDLVRYGKGFWKCLESLRIALRGVLFKLLSRCFHDTVTPGKK